MMIKQVLIDENQLKSLLPKYGCGEFLSAFDQAKVEPSKDWDIRKLTDNTDKSEHEYLSLSIWGLNEVVNNRLAQAKAEERNRILEAICANCGIKGHVIASDGKVCQDCNDKKAIQGED